MTNTNETVTTYLAAWNATDPAERAWLLARAVTEDVRYVDPLADVTGRAALSGVIDAVQQQFPGTPLDLKGAVDAHHDVVRFSWTLGPVVGTDSVLLAEDGRFALVTGCLDQV